MAAKDRYTATPGFHVGDAIGLIQDARANGVKREHATDGLGLLTCAAAAIDEREDPFGLAGFGAAPPSDDLAALYDEAEAQAQQGFGASGDSLSEFWRIFFQIVVSWLSGKE